MGGSVPGGGAAIRRSCARRYRRAMKQAIRNDVERHLAARLAAMADLFNRGDRADVSGHYAQDAVIVGFPPPGAPLDAIVGAAAVADGWRDTPGRRWELESLAVNVRGDLAQQFGRSHLLVEAHGGERRLSTEFLLLWRRGSDGVWRVYADVFKPMSG